MTVESKTHILPSGKQITIYDGLIPAVLRNSMYDFIKDSAFFIGWPDADHERAAKYNCLYTGYTEPQTESLGLLPYLRTTEIHSIIKDLTPTKSVVNLSVPSHVHFPHTHVEKVFILYYVNLHWEDHWHGETLFYSEDHSEIDLAVKYVPGRLVIFDGTIPHSVRPQSMAADNYRFTYALAFD
jgi:hypothetical protein